MSHFGFHLKNAIASSNAVDSTLFRCTCDETFNLVCNKLHFRSSYPGPHSNAFRLITGKVRYFSLICLYGPEFGLYSLNAVRPEGC